MIKQVQNEKSKNDFIEFGLQFSTAEVKQLPTEGNCFLAYENDKVVARCQVQFQTGSNTTATIGYFHALNKPEMVKELLAQAVNFIKKQGAEEIIGPMNGDTWHSYRFNLGPFTEEAFIKEPHNPTYYPALWENAGFEVVDSYDSFLVESSKLAADNQEKFYKRAVKNGYTFQNLTAENYQQFLPVIYKISCEIFSQNRHYSEITYDEFERLYLPAKNLLIKDLSWIAQDSEGNYAGYVFAFPDYHIALESMKGKTNLFAKIKFLINKRKAKRCCLKTLGVTSKYRGSGLTAALTYLVYKNSHLQGYDQTYMCLMHSDNDSRKFSGNQHKPFRKYALYRYKAHAE